MAHQVVSTLKSNLGDYLMREAKFLYGVESQVKDLQKELTLMQGFLKEADARQYEDERIRIWVREIRELAIQAEDVIDTYVFEVSSKTGESKIINILERIFCIVRDGIAVWRVGRKIEDIKDQITNLTRRLQTYGIPRLTKSEGSSSNKEKRPKESFSHIIDQDFTGFQNDINTVVEKLSGTKNEPYQVVCIFGMGGSGKTTLARKIYNHKDVRKRGFDAFAWCCVSQQWDTEDILKQILIKLMPENERKIAQQIYQQLVKQLFDILLEKRCFVVLDDVWSSDFWDIISPAVPYQQMESKILFTTRNKNVALPMGDFCFSYELKQLSFEESWELFQKKAFPRARSSSGSSGRVADGNMEELGKEMVKYCRGLPLAIVVVGGILATKHSLEEWEKIDESIRSCLRGKLREQEENGGILDTLAMSYYDLPHQLKPCFLYLGIFPEDTHIDVDRLYNLWIGEGFVASQDLEGNETMMDLAEYYLGELAQRCMIQVQVSEDTKRIEFCQLHDLMRDLCLLKGKEEKFIEFVDYSCRNEAWNSVTSSSSNNYTRRLSFNLGKYRRVSISKQTTRHLKSIVFFNPHQYTVEDEKKMVSDIKDSKLLKVLDLQELSMWMMSPKDVGKLIFLRYLSFPQFFLYSKLPSSIANLRYLQSLDLRMQSSRLKIPNVLWKLKELRHLYFPENYHVEEKLKLEGLSNLETLKNFSCRECNVKDILKLSQLRVLTTRAELEKSEDLESIECDLEALSLNNNRLLRRHHIYFIIDSDYVKHDELPAVARVVRKLLTWQHLHELYVWGPIGDALLLPPKVALIEGQNFSASLTRLSLDGCKLREDPMPTLERLPNLQFLRLDFLAFVGEEMSCCTQNGFPCLEYLYLRDLDNLKNWRVEKGALPSLSRLTIYRCHKLKMVPSGLKFVTTLQQLSIVAMPQEFQRRIRDEDGQEGEDFHIVQHIPSISFSFMFG